MPLEPFRPPGRPWPQAHQAHLPLIRRYESHELLLADEDARPGGRVNSIAYLGFAEFAEGGVIGAGDAFYLDGRRIGILAGFDETHAPNHLNIVIRAANLVDGVEQGVALGMAVRFAVCPGEVD